MTLKTLELFCGTKSFSKIAKEYGCLIRTIDIDRKFNPDICMDIMELNAIIDPDIVWASPPCQCFSVASISTHWKGGKEAYMPKTEKCKEAIRLLEHTIMLIADAKPRYWFIENPRGVMRKVIEKIFVQYPIGDYKRVTITYCQYGDTRMKPTDIWTNLMEWQPRPMCHNGDKCHQEARRGAKTGTQGLKGNMERSIIPPALFREIFEILTPQTRT